jgi:hypothetical protein
MMISGQQYDARRRLALKQTQERQQDTIGRAPIQGLDNDVLRRKAAELRSPPLPVLSGHNSADVLGSRQRPGTIQRLMQ